MRPSTISPGAHANEHTQTHTNTSAHTHRHRAHAGTGTGATTSTSAHEPRIHAHTPRGTRTSRAHTHTQQAHRRRPTRARAPSGPCPVPRNALPRATHHGDRTGGNSPPGKPPSSYAPKGAKHAAIRPAQMGMTPGTWHAGYGRCWGRCACGQQGTKRAAIG